jgi:hypothetical protein
MTTTCFKRERKQAGSIPARVSTYFNYTVMQSQRPLVGQLLWILPSGKSHVLESGKPFAILQLLKKQYLQRGYKKEQLKITYIR